MEEERKIAKKLKGFLEEGRDEKIHDNLEILPA